MSTPDRPEDHWTAVPPAASAGETPDFSAATAPGAPTTPGPDTAGRDVVQDAVRPAGRRGRRVLAGAALATGLAVGGAAVAAAVTNDGGTRAVDASAGLSAAGGPGVDAGHGPGGGMGGPGVRGALHGELTVPQTDGTGTQVVLVQSGTVTAVSKTSLSVKSTDGFTATYAITSTTRVRTAGDAGITGVKSGATVWVVSSSSRSALMVADRTGGPRGMRGVPGMHDGRPGDRPGDADGDDAPSGTPSGGATSGSTSGTALDAPGVTAHL